MFAEWTAPQAAENGIRKASKEPVLQEYAGISSAASSSSWPHPVKYPESYDVSQRMLAHSVQSFIDHWQELDRTHKLDTSLSISHFYLSTHEPIFHTTARHSFILIALFFSLISMYLLSVDIFVIVFLNLFHSFYTCWCMKPFRSYISSRLCQFIAVTTSVATLRRLGTCIYKRGLHQRSLRESFKCASCRCVHGPDPETARSPSRWLACGSNRRQTQTGEEKTRASLFQDQIP